MPVWGFPGGFSDVATLTVHPLFENKITESLDKLDPKDGHLKKNVSDKRVADKLKAIGDGQVMFKCNCTCTTNIPWLNP